MPEGDTIFRAARTLNQALAGQTVVHFATALVHLARVDDDSGIAGRVVERVEAVGKHLLMTFSGGLILRTHMRMNGSWHIYRPGERWQLPRYHMRIQIETSDWVAVAFKVHVAEFIREAALARHEPLATLGPDLLSDSFDRIEAIARLRAQADRPIGEALLDQRLLAGIGNVYKSEVLFLTGIHPERSITSLSDDTLGALVDKAQQLLRLNVSEQSGAGIVTYRGLRRTTGRMKPEDSLWVYGRGGRPCRRCQTPIAFKKSGFDARVTYWCPKCQSSLTSPT
jgi:endonuclease-8